MNILFHTKNNSSLFELRFKLPGEFRWFNYTTVLYVDRMSKPEFYETAQSSVKCKTIYISQKYLQHRMEQFRSQKQWNKLSNARIVSAWFSNAKYYPLSKVKELIDQDALGEFRDEKDIHWNRVIEDMKDFYNRLNKTQMLCLN